MNERIIAKVKLALNVSVDDSRGTLLALWLHYKCTRLQGTQLST